jgi:uncharacterized sulfatase
MDRHIGRILDALDETGLAEDTLVVFSSDHGDLLGDHGFWWKSLVAYEESIRLPMVVRLPGRVPAGARSAAFQNMIDLAPTFLGYAGAAAPVEMEGVDQRHAWEDADARVREDTVVEERPTDAPWCQRILVTETHKLAFYAGRDYGELYDVQADPDQVRNLWDDPAQADLRDRLIARLLSEEMRRRRPRLGHSAAARLYLEQI